MKIKTIKVTGLLLAPFFLLASEPADAYRYDYCGSVPISWPSDGYTINANPAGFADGTRWYNSLAVAVSRINSNPSRFSMSLRPDNDSDVDFENGESEIWWSDSDNYNPAVAFTFADCDRTEETDVIFYNQGPYNDAMADKTNFWGYGGNARAFEATAIHELGHTAGLHHVNGEYNVMGTGYFHVHANGGVLRSYLGEDAADGLVDLYGGGNGEDVSLSHWKRIGASGQYSEHGHTEIYNSNGSVLSGSVFPSGCTVACETRYSVGIGDQVQFEVTAENNGANSQNVNISYYISTNDSITTEDTLLETDSINVSRGDVDTFKKTLTIPTSLQGNTDYAIGAIIDSNNALNETTNANNGTYLLIRTGSGGGGDDGGGDDGGDDGGGDDGGGDDGGQGPCHSSNKCGTQTITPEGCFCDPICVEYGDCCSDGPCS